MDKIGEIKCRHERGAIRWLSEVCKVLDKSNILYSGDKTRTIAIPMKTIVKIKPTGYKEPITIKQWLIITNEALLGREGDSRILTVEVSFRDTPPYIGGYVAYHIRDLSAEEKNKLKKEVRQFLDSIIKQMKLPKYAQCTIEI
jgi:predicted deacetylase